MISCQIDPKLIPIKLSYFLFYGGLSSFMPFKSIYQKQLGMSSTQNGVIQATMQLVSLISPPIAGVITDKTKAYKIVLCTLLFFSVAFTVPFYFVPPNDSSAFNETVSCCFTSTKHGLIACSHNATESNSTLCSSHQNTTIVMDALQFQQCLDSPGNCIALVTPVTPVAENVYGSTFAWLVVLTALMSFFLAPVTPLLDSSVMDTLGRENVSSFGIQRLWGAVGFGVVGLGVGFLTDIISPLEVYGPYNKNYLLAFCGVAIFWGCTIFVMVASVTISAPKAKGILRGLRKLVTKGDVLFFLFIVLMSGYSTGVQYSYLFWYLQDFKDFEQLVLGMSVLITCASEIPMFWISGWICDTFGYVSVLSMGLCAVSIRFYLYTVITGAWQILAVEWLHGISFALPMAAICSYATIVAPKDAVATLISFSQTVYWGVGNMLGALLGGLLYNEYGAKILFRVSAVACFACGLLYWMCLGPFGILELLRRRKRKDEVLDEVKIPTREDDEGLGCEENLLSEKTSSDYLKEDDPERV